MLRVVVVGSSHTEMSVGVPALPAAGRTVLGDSFTATPGGKGASREQSEMLGKGNSSSAGNTHDNAL